MWREKKAADGRRAGKTGLAKEERKPGVIILALSSALAYLWKRQVEGKLWRNGRGAQVVAEEKLRHQRNIWLSGSL